MLVYKLKVLCRGHNTFNLWQWFLLQSLCCTALAGEGEACKVVVMLAVDALLASEACSSAYICRVSKSMYSQSNGVPVMFL